MSQLQDLVKQIAELDPVDRETLLNSLSEEIEPILAYWNRYYPHEDFPSIVATPTVCGGVARLIRTRIPVWTLARMWQLGFSDCDVLRSYPTLRAEDLVQARSYISRHRAEIDHEIRENEEE